jgi:hypothetical protein
VTANDKSATGLRLVAGSDSTRPGRVARSPSKTPHENEEKTWPCVRTHLVRCAWRSPAAVSVGAENIANRSSSGGSSMCLWHLLGSTTVPARVYTLCVRLERRALNWRRRRGLRRICEADIKVCKVGTRARRFLVFHLKLVRRFSINPNDNYAAVSWRDTGPCDDSGQLAGNFRRQCICSSAPYDAFNL